MCCVLCVMLTYSVIQTECGEYMRISCGVPLVPHNIVMDLNNVLVNFLGFQSFLKLSMMCTGGNKNRTLLNEKLIEKTPCICANGTLDNIDSCIYLSGFQSDKLWKKMVCVMYTIDKTLFEYFTKTKSKNKNKVYHMRKKPKLPLFDVQKIATYTIAVWEKP